MIDEALHLDPLNSKYNSDKGVILSAMNRDIQTIISFYDKAIKLDKTNISVYYNKGLILGKNGQYKEAMECFDTALKLNPDLYEIYNSKGVVLQEFAQSQFKKIYNKSIEYFDTALKLNPNDLDIYYNKVLSLYKLGRYKEANSICDFALQLDPSHTLLSRICNEIKNKLLN